MNKETTMKNEFTIPAGDHDFVAAYQGEYLVVFAMIIDGVTVYPTPSSLDALIPNHVRDTVRETARLNGVHAIQSKQHVRAAQEQHKS